MIKNSKIFVLICIVILAGCSAPVNTPVKQTNLAKQYNPSTAKIHPAFTVYHDSDASSLLFVKLYPKEFLYSQANEEGIYKATVKLNYELTNISDTSKRSIALADSGTVTYSFNREGVENRFITSIKIAAPKGNTYLLKISATDMVRKEEISRYIYLDKLSNLSQQNFIVMDSTGKIPFFSPYVLGNQIFRLDSRNKDSYDSIYVKYYGSDMPLPKPSFSSIRERNFLDEPDSLWILPFRSNLIYQLFYKGMYFFQVDTTAEEGVTLLNFGNEYPQIKTPEQLVDPLAYLTTSIEYENFKNATNKKIIVDDFWLNKTENTERARELIRIFYNRVYLANYYFTTFKPGWKTDRGMIYVIYGPPQGTYRSLTDEKWVYYRKNYSSSITFTFNYVQSPYTQDNFILQRSEAYDSHWREAVDTWRKGQVFLLD